MCMTRHGILWEIIEEWLVGWNWEGRYTHWVQYTKLPLTFGVVGKCSHRSEGVNLCRIYLWNGNSLEHLNSLLNWFIDFPRCTHGFNKKNCEKTWQKKNWESHQSLYIPFLPKKYRMLREPSSWMCWDDNLSLCLICNIRRRRDIFLIMTMIVMSNTKAYREEQKLVSWDNKGYIPSHFYYIRSLYNSGGERVTPSFPPSKNFTR